LVAEWKEVTGKVAEILPWAEMVAYHLLAYAMVEAQEAALSSLRLCLTW
jgi:hypothetical protein